MKNFKNNKMNNNNDYIISSDKELNKNDQNNYYLNKYRNKYGNSFNDIELLDIFAKNNYNDKQIMEDIKALLSIGTNKKYDNYNNYNSYDRNYKSHKSTSKSRGKKKILKKDLLQNVLKFQVIMHLPQKKKKMKIIKMNQIMKLKVIKKN